MSSSAHILVSGFPVSCAYFLYCYFLYCSVDLFRFPANAFLTLPVEEVVLPCVLHPNRAAGLTGFFEYPQLFGGNLQHRDSAPCMHCHFVHPQLHDSSLFYFTPYHLGTTLLSSTSRSTQRNSLFCSIGCSFSSGGSYCSYPPFALQTQTISAVPRSTEAVSKALANSSQLVHKTRTEFTNKFLHGFIVCKTEDHQWPVSLKHQGTYFN